MRSRTSPANGSTVGGTEQFDREKLIALPSSDGGRRVITIIRYDFKEKMITVIWKDELRNNKMVHTDFDEFSADGRQMVQLPNDQGHRHKFTVAMGINRECGNLRR